MAAPLLYHQRINGIPQILRDSAGSKVPWCTSPYGSCPGHEEDSNLTPAAGPNPPLVPAAGVPSLLTQALGQLVAAQCAVARAGATLALVPFDDPARHRTDHLAIDVTRSVNELGGLVEALLNVGVQP